MEPTLNPDKPVTLGPWVKGFINVVPLQSIPEDGLSYTNNINIDRDGTITDRTRWEIIYPSNSHSIFESSLGRTFAIVEGELAYLDSSGVNTLATVVGTVDWTELNGLPVFCTSDGIFRVNEDDTVEQLVATPNTREEELVLQNMPGGTWVEYWQGRLVVARGTSLIFSEPLRYGAHDPMRGFIRMGGRIRWMAVVDTGIYVGLENVVKFVEGTNPDKVKITTVGGRTWDGAAATITTEHIDPDIAKGANRVAVWMSPEGFAIGHPSGTVVYPQADRLKDIPIGKGKLVVLGDRLTVLSI